MWEKAHKIKIYTYNALNILNMFETTKFISIYNFSSDVQYPLTKSMVAGIGKPFS